MQLNNSGHNSQNSNLAKREIIIKKPVYGNNRVNKLTKQRKYEMSVWKLISKLQA